MWGPLISLLPGWHSIVPAVRDAGKASFGALTSRLDGERPPLVVRDRRELAHELFAHARLLRQVSSAAELERSIRRWARGA